MDDGDDSGIALAVVDANGRADHRQGGFPGFLPKTDETRGRRLTQALEWMAAGKSRNWKYERK